MNREFDNEFEQEDERLRGRSRRRGIDAGPGADSDTMPPRRAGSAGEAPGQRPRTDGGAAGRRPGIQGDTPGRRPVTQGAASGQRPRYTGETPAGRPGYTGRKAGERPRFTGERPDGKPVMTGTGIGERPRYTGDGNTGRTSAGAAAGNEAGRTYKRAYEGIGESVSGRGRDTAYRRAAGGSSGRRAAREAAAADPAAMEIRHRRKLIITMIILELLFLLFVGGYRYIQGKANLIQPSTFNPRVDLTNPNLDNVKIDEMDDYWTIALFGVDSRNNSVGKGNNADVIIICNIAQKTGEIKLVSVFRDTYLNISDNGIYNKINQAYFLGGPKQAVEAMNRNLDLQIDDYATFNWKAVVDAVNILGGVDVEISKAEFYYINAYITETVEATGVASHHLKQAGANHLDGVQAVAYARLRKMDTDFARTERQREIINLCFQKLKKSDFAVINNVMEVVFPQILSSVTLDDVIPAARNLTKYTIAETMGFPEARSDANMGKKGACVIPQTLESNVTRLHQFLFGDENYQPSEMVKKISAKISADTGMYNEAKPVESVGTDGGYIPKPTQATKATEKTEAEEDESESSTSGTDESIIDGEDETDLELETDEFGNVLDPPEGWPYTHPGQSPSSSTVRPGSSTTESDEGDEDYPGGDVLPGDHTTGPGANTRPGQDNNGAAYPGGANGTTSPYPGSTQGTTAEHPGNIRGSMAESPGSTTEEYVPEGPGSVIIGPGN